MQINKAKKYGEFVEITAPVERTTSEEYPTILGGEIWYNQYSFPKKRKLEGFYESLSLAELVLSQIDDKTSEIS